MGYIYIITNDINDKVYIGLTRRSLSCRWKEHINKAILSENDSRHDTYFYKAIRKYGQEHFQIEELEYVEDDSILSDRECYWIAEYDSYKNGYNSTVGGDGAVKYNYQNFKDLWDKGYGVNDIAEEFDCSRNTVYNALSSFSEWKIEAKERQKEKALIAMQDSRKISVDCYDLQGNFLKTYSSSRSAAIELNIAESMISISLNTGGRAKEYMFVKHGDCPPKPYQKKGSKAVDQYDLQGNFISTYESMEGAALAIGKQRSAANSIRLVCKGDRKTAYGYKWKWRE